MRWSYSASRSFRQCQRQWYYKNIVASARANDPIRKRAYLLSKLQSVSAWRGRIVDDVISKIIVPEINRGHRITLRTAKVKARELFDRQLKYAMRHPINDLNLKVSSEGDDFAVFYGMEYGKKPTPEELDRAWDEIETALGNLFKMDGVRRPLKSAEYVIAQRALQFGLMDGITVLAYPDAVAFQSKEAPLIVDWKVHAFGQNDAWLQLAIYAISLSRSNHRDFPSGFACSAEEIVLLEAQLLTDSVREHRLEVEQIEEAEEYILDSAYEISCLLDGKKYPELNALDFRPATHAETCQRCAFRALCWENMNAH